MAAAMGITQNRSGAILMRKVESMVDSVMARESMMARFDGDAKGDPASDGNCHNQCTDGTHCVYIKTITEQFCVDTGQTSPNWCAGEVGKPWCICRWAFAEFVQANSCDKVTSDLGGIDCDKSGTTGIDTGVCDQYSAGNTADGTASANLQPAKNCVASLCPSSSCAR